MRYEVSLPPTIRNLAEWQLEHYRSDKKQLAQLERELIHFPATDYGNIRSSKKNSESRPTEINAINLLSAPYIQRMETGVTAVEFALRGADQTNLQLVSLVYWRKENNIEGAALKCNISKTAAYNRINGILASIAYMMGFIKFDDLKG